MKTLFFTLALVACVSQLNAQRILSEDFNPLIGVNWEGGLTYLNYSDNKNVTLPVTLSVSKKDENSFLFSYKYTNEPNANRTATIKIKKNGMRLGKEKLVSKEILEDGSVKLITSGKGKDDGKKATYLFTYILGPNTFSTQKEVTYIGETNSLIRNAYNLQNKGQKKE